MDFSKDEYIKFDKYYTKNKIALGCYNLLKLKVITTNNILYIEPSAGGGSFLNVIQEDKIGFDILPTSTNIIKLDFLKESISDYIKDRKVVFIGNPPYGTKSKLAIEFVNKCLVYSDMVGFILPIQFRKWSSQSKIDKTAKLIMDIDLAENSFELMGKDFNIRSCFQIWSKNSTDDVDLRLQSKPSTTHIDFELYQYNRTDGALKFFDYNWDFAVYRQGYKDYNYKAFNKDECDRKHQWIFFKANSDEILNRLLSIDFVKLSKKNIGIPGFGKADVILEYKSLYGLK